MQIVDCTSKMTKFYLQRIANSIVKEQISKNADRERLKEHIDQNVDSLSDSELIIKKLSFKKMSRSNRILMDGILRNLLELPDSKCEEDALFSLIQEYENEIINKAEEIDLTNYMSEKDIDVYKTILEVALEDNIVTKDEFALLEKLREKLKINRFYNRIIEAQLNKFPKDGNIIHDREEYKETIKLLQNKGIVFYCNEFEKGNILVLPEEIRPGVKQFLGFEMGSDSHKLFHKILSKNQLQKISRNLDLSPYGKKDDLSDRIIEAGCKPSEELNILSANELYEICKKLKGVQRSGRKEEKIKRIIQYFDNIVLKKPEDTEDERAKYYQYYEELSRRDNQQLIRINLIKKDIEMEHYFEEATRYIFEKKLGCELIKFSGTENPDGGISYPDGELLLWDNKSKETTYSFPESHYKQFKRYIRKSPYRVKVFLIIVPDIKEECEIKIIKLKNETKTDTDVALITARNLKYIAENWEKLQKSEKFNINLFNITGILNRKRIDLQFKLY